MSFTQQFVTLRDCSSNCRCPADGAKIFSVERRMMSSAVIPAPGRLDHNGGEFAFRSGMTIAYIAVDVAPIVERFCLEVTRRTGLRVLPMTGNPGANEPCIRIELTTGDELQVLPAPRGVSPTGGGLSDERHSLVIDEHRVVVRAAEPVGVARGLSTLIQLLATAPSTGASEISVPATRILDAPRYAWRGLSLDLARTFFTVDEVQRVIDLLALYKLNVLHLHLTDDQSWRLPVGRSAENSKSDVTFYSAEDLLGLAAYAEDRFVTIVPEVNTPGHASAFVRMRPELNAGRNVVQFELPPGHTHHTAWLDPELPATFEVVEEVLAGVAAIFRGPYIHIGGDEPRGMPHDLYSSYVQSVRGLVRSIGKRPLGWQESARAGLGPDDVIQYWFSDIDLPASVSPEVRAQMDADVAISRRDVETAVVASVPVIVSPLSHCYLDVPYAEASTDPGQTQRQGRVGLRLYSPRTVAESFDWEPAEALGHGRAAHVAGVEAAIWAETISDFGDLCFLLLPRLAGVAHKAWSDPRVATWTDHRNRLARHGRLWAQDGLTYFRTSTVDWL
jgi:hexosaminidase